MIENRVNSFTVGAHLISFRMGEFLKRTWYDFQILQGEDKYEVAPEIISKLKPPSENGSTEMGEEPTGAPTHANHDRRDQLADPDREALAQFLATPRLMREFKSLTALAAHLKISRMTIHRWKKDVDVLRRADWLAVRNKLAGDLVARREWQSIVEAQVASAKQGSTSAARFCENRAWPEDQRTNPLDRNLTLSEAIKETENTEEIPEWLKEEFEAKRIDPDVGPGDERADGESREPGPGDE